MGLLGSSWDDPQSEAVMALAGGLLQGNFGKGAENYGAVLAHAKDRDLKRTLVQAQLGDMQAQAELRRAQAAQAQQKQDFMLKLFGDGGGAPPGGSQGGAPGGASGGELAGIDRTAAMLDFVNNGGKNIGAWINDRTKPDMQVSGGYAFNKNAIGPGYLPQMNIARDGQASLVQIGPDGLPVVSAPTGALETFAKYRNVDEGTKANYDPLTVTPQGQNPQMTTRGALVRNPVVQGVQPQAASDRQLILQTELDKAKETLNRAIALGDQSGAARAQGDIAAISREMGGKGATVGMPLQSESEKLRDAAGVKGDAAENEARSKDVKTAQKFLTVVGQAEQSLKNGPTASGFGALVDSGAAFFGKATPGAIEAQRLKALGGWLVSNVPRMEGPQSNFDVANYQMMAADVANEKLPIERRQAALTSIKDMMQKTVDTAGKPTPEAQTKTFRDHGYNSEAEVIRDAQNTIMRNPAAKAEVLRRLKDMGIQMPRGAQGSF